MSKAKPVKFNKKQLKYLNNLLEQAKPYADKGMALAIKDVRALQKGIVGIPSNHLKSMLAENIMQIDSSIMWSANSSGQLKIMVGILKTMGVEL